MERVRNSHVAVAAALALLGLLLATLPARGDSASKVVRLSVPANAEWVPGGVTLKAGESASITATGTISYGSGLPACQGIPITPDGCGAETARVPGAAGALIAQVGAAAPLVVGSAGTVTGPGAIRLGVNDWVSELGNNSGSFAVTIRTIGAPPPPELPPASDANTRPVDAKSTKTGRTNFGGVTITRDGQRYRMTSTSQLRTGDVISTNGETVLTLEFAIGGRVGLSPGASVRILGDRQIENLGGTTTARPSIDQPLEIQTNGGTMGIRG